MEFKCAKSDFNAAIQIVEKAVSIRSTLPIIGNILLESTKEGLKLSSNDLEIGIELLIDANIVKEGTILAPAKTLSSIVSKLSEGEVSFKVEENNNIRITCNRSKFNIHGLPTDEFPVLHKINNGVKLSLKADVLKEMVKQTIIAVSLDESKPVLNGVYVEIDKNEIIFVATDSYRLAKRVFMLNGSNAGNENISVIIPTKALQELSRILQQEDYKGDIKITISNEQIAFEFDSLYFISRLIQGKYPDYRQVIPKETKTRITLARKDLLESAERASIIASASANIIKLEEVDNKLLITANTANVGNVSELMDISKEGGAIEPVAFNVRLIMDVLKNIDEDNISLTLNSALSAGMVTPKENKNYTYVIMPIRTAS